MAASTFTDPISFIHDQGTNVTVKTLPQTAASQNELHTLHELQGHPNIINLRKFENTDNHLRIYMDYHPCCLLDLLTTHPDGRPLSLVKHIFLQLIMTLNYIHKCGYIHHDIASTSSTLAVLSLGHPERPRKPQGWDLFTMQHPRCGCGNLVLDLKWICGQRVCASFSW